MAGDIFFSKHNWAASSWATFYVLKYLANRVSDVATREMLMELVENNIPMLDLRDCQHAHLVDILADQLPHELPTLEDPELQQKFTALISELVAYAREQQTENRRKNGS
jgi:hypothetical protein